MKTVTLPLKDQLRGQDIVDALQFTPAQTTDVTKAAILAALGLTGLTVGGSSITFTAAGGSIELPIG